MNAGMLAGHMRRMAANANPIRQRHMLQAASVLERSPHLSAETLAELNGAWALAERILKFQPPASPADNTPRQAIAA